MNGITDVADGISLLKYTQDRAIWKSMVVDVIRDRLTPHKDMMMMMYLYP